MLHRMCISGARHWMEKVDQRTRTMGNGGFLPVPPPAEPWNVCDISKIRYDGILGLGKFYTHILMEPLFAKLLINDIWLVERCVTLHFSWRAGSHNWLVK